MAAKKPKRARKPAEDVSGQIRQFIKESGLTHIDLAQESGVNPSILWRFVNGEQPSISTATLGQLMGPLKIKLVKRAGSTRA